MKCYLSPILRTSCRQRGRLKRPSQGCPATFKYVTVRVSNRMCTNASTFTRESLIGATCMIAALLLASCSGSNSAAVGAGGTLGTGGTVTGGAGAATGGATVAVDTSVGGAATTGGFTSSGGSPNTASDTVSTGGNLVVGGSSATGGSQSAGGNAADDITAITVSLSTTCALRQSGLATCWGANSYYQLGYVMSDGSAKRNSIKGVTDAISVAPGFDHTCVVLRDGSVGCCGNNTFDQLGNSSLTALGNADVSQVAGTSSAVAASAAVYHTCVRLTGGGIQCWGNGALGNGSSDSSAVPVTVTGIANATAIAAGGNDMGSEFNCAILSGGVVKCWGVNDRGQLGNGSKISANSPVALTGVTNAAAIAAGGEHACAVLGDETARCWGYNFNGQLGDGTTTDSSVPLLIQDVTSVVAVAAGESHSCVMRIDGTILCWGANKFGQLGDGTTTDRMAPVEVTGISNAAAIAAGGDRTCALLDTGAVTCWGSAIGYVPVTVTGL